MTEEVSNGSFSNGSTDWTLGTGWSIGENKAIYDNSASSVLNQSFTWEVGKTYKITFDIGDFTTSQRFDIYSGVSFIKTAVIESDTSYTIYFNGDGGSTFRFRGLTTESFSITNISVKEVLQNWSVEDYGAVSASAVITPNTEGVKLEKTVSADWRSSFLVQPISYTSGSQYKVTFRLKNGNLPSGGSVYVRRAYDSSSQSIVNNLALTNDWVEYTYYFVADSNSEDISFGEVNWQNAGVGQYFYVDNISVIEITTDTSLPRINYEGFSYDGSGNVVPDSGCGSWLFEPQSTNLIPYSETLGNNTTSGGISFTYNNSISPDGTQNAALVSVTSANDRLQPSFAAVNSLVAISIFLKHNGTDFSTQINTFNTGTGTLFGARAHVTATDVTFTSYSGGFDSASFVDYGNGWFRVIVVCQSTTGTTFVQWRPTSVNATLSYPCFGFQVEVQDFATSYIPTDRLNSYT